MTAAMGHAEIDALRGALFFADISGFSRLTDQLSSRPDGAERIGDFLNQYLGRLVDQIEAHGGDVLKFAGDAVIALWTVQDDADDATRGLAAATQAAAACALRAQRLLEGFEAGDVTLSMRICIDAGELRLMHVGGVLNRWETVPCGGPVSELAELKPLTPIGAVVLSERAWAMLDWRFRGKVALRSSELRQTLHDIEVLQQEGRIFTSQEPTTAVPMRLSWSDDLPAASPLVRASVSPETEELLRAWVPGVMLSSLANGLSEWHSELRRISVVFAQLPGTTSESADLDRAQTLVASLQRSVYRFDGGIDKISVDEKGAVLIACFGLPPLSHEDDPLRSLHAAMAMRKAMTDQGVAASIGVATGQVFCGTVGTKIRCEYTVIGHTVNLAARLMEASEGRLLCDDATAKLASAQLEMIPVAKMEIRGHQEPVQVWTPTGLVRAAVRAKTALVGRQTERDVLGRAIQSVVRTRHSAFVVVEGEAGIGKSRLLNELAQQAETVGLRILRGAGDAVDRNAPYHPWRPVFSEILGISPADSLAERAAKVRAAVALLPADLRELAPLLESVIVLDLGQDEGTEAFTGEARLAQTHRLLTALLQCAVDESHVGLILEDCHWFDSASWALLRAVRLSVSPLLVVVATRAMERNPPEYEALIADASVDRLRLGPLTRDDCGELAAQRLGARTVPSDVIDFIHQRAGGNALYVEELAAVLHENGSLEVDIGGPTGGQARLTVPFDQLAQTRLPATLEGLIVSRLDALGAGEQMTLKVASVVGRLFPLDVVTDVFPLEGRKGDVSGMLPGLVEQDLIRTTDAPDQYLFKHVLTQEAIYGLMLFGQRRGLHRAVAEWYERTNSDDLSHLLPVLAHHWQRAEEWSKALACLEQAAEQNLDRYANRETVDLLGQALTLDREHPGQSTPMRRMNWFRHLAEAWFRLGDLANAKKYGQDALKLLGVQVPTTLLGTLPSLLGQIALRTLERLVPGRFAVTAPDERDRRLWATRVLNRMTEIHIYAENALGCLDSGMRELNTVEPLGPTAELGKAYAVMAVVVGTVPPLAGLSHAWGQRAIQVTQAAPNPGSALSYVLSRVGIVDLYGANWPDATDKLRRAAEIGRISGDRRLREEAVGVLGITLFFASRFAESRSNFEALKASAHFSNNVQIQAWSRFGMAAYHLRAGDADQARQQLLEVEDWVQKSASASEVLWSHGMLALAWFRVAEPEKAEALADTLLPYIQKMPVAYWVQHALAALSEVYLLLWEQVPPESPRAKILKGKARIACRALRIFSWSFAFGRPHAQLWDGLLEHMSGNPARAQRHWLRCIEIAEAQTMPWEASLARRELARSLPLTDPRRAEYLKRATTDLQQLGAIWDLTRLPSLQPSNPQPSTPQLTTPE
jgi:class 3 adenylate cyclase